MDAFLEKVHRFSVGFVLLPFTLGLSAGAQMALLSLIIRGGLAIFSSGRTLNFGKLDVAAIWNDGLSYGLCGVGGFLFIVCFQLDRVFAQRKPLIMFSDLITKA